MRHRFLSPQRSILAAFFVACTFLQSGGVYADCLLRVGWDSWPPYIDYQNGQFHGLEYRQLKSTADAAGCQLRMIKVPWVRALRMLKDGELDLLYGADYSPERARFAKFSAAYRDERFVLMTRGSASDASRTVSLSAWLRSPASGKGPRKLGLFRGNYYGKQIDHVLKENAGKVTIIYLGTNEQMVRMLGLGRLDGYIVEDGVAQTEIPAARYPLRRSIIQEQVADSLYYMFSLKVADSVVQRFNQAIEARRQGR